MRNETTIFFFIKIYTNVGLFSKYIDIEIQTESFKIFHENVQVLEIKFYRFFLLEICDFYGSPVILTDSVVKRTIYRQNNRMFL